ncbi:hypothetical protein CCR94_21630 [Rhodoblastus sphagnicola]|uniref:Uncharacterized protein n=1 Tax=Rhodoblastus sphagnicola TaxID=333368 RepID=A0A2S6MWI3_9HYPH|nr:hypothetical protein CCR94_21630 [Rhodoblastus sphagnicola]
MGGGSSQAHKRGRKTAVQTNIVVLFYSKCFYMTIEFDDQQPNFCGLVMLHYPTMRRRRTTYR